MAERFADILSEARKYGLNLIVANQFTTQLTDEIRDAVFGNVGTIVSFRVGTQDAEALTKIFQPIFDADDLQRVPNANAVVRMLIQGVPSQPFSMATLPPLGADNKKLVMALKQLSAAKYGRPRAIVEAEIFKRLETIEPAKPAAPFPKSSAAPSAPGGRPQSGVPAAPPATTPGTGSFLDEWLAKRQTRQQSPAAAHHAPAALPSSQSAPRHSPPVSSTAVSPLAPAPSRVFAPTEPRQNLPSPHDAIHPDRLDTKGLQAMADEFNAPKQPPVEKSPNAGIFNEENTIYIDRDGHLKNDSDS